MPKPSRNQPVVSFCTCMALSQATRRVHRIFDAALSEHGLKIGQFGILAHVRRMPGLTLAELAEMNVMDPSTVSRLMRALFDRELVETEIDPADRRTRRLRLTAQGETLYDAAVPAWRAAHDRLDTAVGLEVSRQVRALMHDVLAAL